MNRYQNVIACIIRFIAVGLTLYSLISITTVLLVARQMWRFGVMASIPLGIGGIILFVIAIPLAKLITLGIADRP
jgi:hypothetical protein